MTDTVIFAVALAVLAIALGIGALLLAVWVSRR